MLFTCVAFVECTEDWTDWRRSASAELAVRRLIRMQGWYTSTEEPNPKEGREAVMFGGRGLGEGACLAFGWFIAYVCLLDKIPNTHPIWDVHCSIHSLRCCVYRYCTVCVDLLTLEWQYITIK